MYVSNLKLIFQQPIWVAMGRNWRELSKTDKYRSVRAWTDAYAKFGVCSSYGLRETLSGYNRHTDIRTHMA